MVSVTDGRGRVLVSIGQIATAEYRSSLLMEYLVSSISCNGGPYDVAQRQHSSIFYCDSVFP